MAYFTLNPRENSAYTILRRDIMDCHCPVDTPVAICIPNIDPRTLNQDEAEAYREHPFMIKARCTRCRKRYNQLMPFEYLPSVTTNARRLILEAMRDRGCEHEITHFYISDPIDVQGELHFFRQSNRIVREDEPRRHLVYCDACRHTIKLYLPVEDQIM